MDLQNVMQKLRKLQKLYEGAKKINSEGEAANAAAAIQRLLAQYNLTMAEVSQSEEEEKKKTQPGHEIISGYTYKSIGGMWEYRLWYVICKWNFCKCFMYGNSYKHLMIVGSKENTEVVKWMFSMLSERFVEFSKDRFKEYKKTEEYQMLYRKPSKDRYQRGYLMGAVEGLDKKLTEIHEQDKKAEPEFHTKVTALAVRSNTAIDEYLRANFKMGSTRNMSASMSAGVYGARQAGRRDGYNTNINKPISENRHKAASGVKLLK